MTRQFWHMRERETEPPFCTTFYHKSPLMLFSTHLLAHSSSPLFHNLDCWPQVRLHPFTWFPIIPTPILSLANLQLNVNVTPSGHISGHLMKTCVLELMNWWADFKLFIGSQTWGTCAQLTSINPPEQTSDTPIILFSSSRWGDWKI